MADDSDSSHTCCSQGHAQSPTLVAVLSASMEAMIAWMGMRPLAISWPPARRAADARGAAHRFSEMSTPAVLAGSMDAAILLDVVLGQQLGQLGLQRLKFAELADVRELHRVDRAIRVLGQDQDVDDADRAGVDEREQFCLHLAGEVAGARWELDDDVVDGAEVIEGRVCHGASFAWEWARALLARHRDAEAFVGRD